MRPIDPYAEVGPGVALAPAVSVTTTARPATTSSDTPAHLPTPNDGPIDDAFSGRDHVVADIAECERPHHPPLADRDAAHHRASDRAHRDRAESVDVERVIRHVRARAPVRSGVRAIPRRAADRVCACGRRSRIERATERASRSAVGLMQIVPVVLDDYNKRHGTAYQSEHLTDPATNVAIGCELLRLSSRAIARPSADREPASQLEQPAVCRAADARLERRVLRGGGVGRVARYLEGLGALDITMDQVSAHARIAGASKHLSNPAKLAWCKSVVALYLRERALGLPSPLV